MSSNVAKIKIAEVFDKPKHFYLKSEIHSDPEDFVDSDSDKEDVDIRFYVRRHETLKETFNEPVLEQPDPDFMMPSCVREILRSEGLSSQVIDKAIWVGEKRHRLAMHLTVQQEKKCQRANDGRKNGKKSVNSLQLPRLDVCDGSQLLSSSDHSLICQDCRDVSARQRRRHERARPWQDVSPSRTEMSDAESTSKSKELKFEKVTFCLTEAETTQWMAAQQIERSLVGSGFEPPRLVLVSSKMSKCQYLPKVLLEDKSILHIIYDFDTWSFCDILNAVEKKLSSVKPGCKAKSILLLCQGGPGYLYILRKFVITPQKLKKESYKGVREFWKDLSSMVSKLNPEDSKLHLCGCDLASGAQGYEVMNILQRLIHHNMVYIENATSGTQEDHDIVTLYFDKRRYELWRSKQDDSDDEIDFDVLDDKDDDTESVVRTWSSLAADANDSDQG
ncbi:NMDA receptor synaptonuclear signaling and neuronal migration factor-like [Argopecten irradians]|uniref:NMDA receptor synaptonuclear signaling and neuronal migration factor-like n=1 Tax=Argopecten irradians TaxID=31199 RepID=UPI00371F3D7C